MKIICGLSIFASIALISKNAVGHKIVFVVSAHSSDPAHVEACKKKVNSHFKVSHKYFMDCHVEMKGQTTSDEEIYKKLGCSVKCILKKEGLLDSNDMPTEDLMKSGVKERVTDDYADKLSAKFMECKKKYGDKLNKDDTLCEAYKDFGLCTQEAVSHVCYE